MRRRNSDPVTQNCTMVTWPVRDVYIETKVDGWNDIWVHGEF